MNHEDVVPVSRQINHLWRGLKLFCCGRTQFVCAVRSYADLQVLGSVRVCKLRYKTVYEKGPVTRSRL